MSTQATNAGGTCKALCWAAGMMIGGYLSYILVIDFNQDILQSAVLGIVALLVVGLLLRRIFCRGNAGKLQERMREAAERRSGPDDEAVTLPSRTQRVRTDESLSVSRAASDAGAVAADITEADAPVEAAVAREAETLTLEAAEVVEEEAAAPVAETAPEEMPAIEPEQTDAGDGAMDEPADDAPEAEVIPRKPNSLDAPQDGTPDDLRLIKGIGPETQKALNEIGIFHFFQIAKLHTREMAYLDQNMPGAVGDATRGKWKKQAKVLAEGGDTRFSSRVKAGKVY